jgi:hypothetical protein
MIQASLQRLITFKPEELVLHTLYRTQDDPNPGTKARRRHVPELVRTGLQDALKALEGGAECVGTSGFTTRENVLLATTSPDADKLVKEAYVDIARSEAVDAELDRLISMRASQDRRPDEDEQEELWKASVRAYEEKRRQMARLEWHAFHCGQAERHRATLRALVEHHEEQAAKLMKEQPKGAA